MNARLLAIVALGVLAGAVLLMRDGGGAPPPLPPPRARAPRPVRTAATPQPVLTRNVFEYGPRPAPAATARPALPSPVLAPPVTAPPAGPEVQLIGMVRRSGAVKAVLKVRGQTVEVAAGETAGGYRVVAIDDDGVRLQAADGTVVTLTDGGS